MMYISPAKINLHLDIGPIRADGYHDLSSLLIMVDLSDLLHVNISGGDGRVTVAGNHAVVPAQDIMLKAAVAFQEATGRTDGINIRICKRIPIGAGLGGGSSNAASVLIALNQIYGSPLAREGLTDLAAQIGSDVPFFLGCAAARVTGRGEIVDSFFPRRTWWVLLVDPGFGVNTQAAYEWLDRARGSEISWEPDPMVIERFQSAPPDAWSFKNSFEKVLAARHPEISRILDSTAGSVMASVSGSGSTCFALFDTYETASLAAARLGPFRFWLKETLASSPNAVLQ